MDKKKILLISGVLALAVLPTLGVDPNPYVLHHIDAQFLAACFGALAAILLRPIVTRRQQRWRNRRAAKKSDFAARGRQE
jgi:hypothetical protein